MIGRIILAAAILAMAGALWWWHARTAGPSAWQGYAEADFVKVGPTLAGLLTSVSVERGSQVTCGAPLFDQDDEADRAALDQASRQLAQAERQLANLQSGGKLTEIEQAQANLADAQATRDKLQLDLNRYENLLKYRAVPAQLVDQQRADVRSASAKVQALEAALTQMRAPLGREAEIRAQNAAVGAARAAIAMAKWRFDQRHVRSPAAGVVADVLARPGETLPAGGPVVSLLPPENIFVRFFVPEAALATLHYGEKVALSCDSCPKGLTATISFISPQAEYTPPVIYSESSRAKLVYRIEARPLPQQASLLNPGQPLEVRPAATGGPQ
ncbi:MAG: HlyD family efflux transporter periplasmic adaptor subunit [Methylocapsa sp.]|nr:HlyD family efflux transporter periplasmic adaptor subunit [Methylocapsa sp.]